jgi:hypothetical protein
MKKKAITTDDIIVLKVMHVKCSETISILFVQIHDMVIYIVDMGDLELYYAYFEARIYWTTYIHTILDKRMLCDSSSKSNTQ